MSEETWSRVRDGLLLLPRFVRLLSRLFRDPEVGRLEKAIVLAAIAYVVNPLDILPDALPWIGQIDDLYVTALVLLRFLNRSGSERLQAAWDGPGDLAKVVQQAIEIATAALPNAVRRRVIAFLGRPRA